jgi:hypothetical protein
MGRERTEWEMGCQQGGAMREDWGTRLESRRLRLAMAKDAVVIWGREFVSQKQYVCIDEVVCRVAKAARSPRVVVRQ